MARTAQDFEALLLGLLLKSMRGSASNGLLGASQDAQTYRDMLDQETGRSMAKAGGIGLARMILTDQARRQKPGSEAAGPAGGEAIQEDASSEKKLLKSPAEAADRPSNGLTSVKNGRLP